MSASSTRTPALAPAPGPRHYALCWASVTKVAAACVWVSDMGRVETVASKVGSTTLHPQAAHQVRLSATEEGALPRPMPRELKSSSHLNLWAWVRKLSAEKD